jgi:hypothetical protein
MEIFEDVLAAIGNTPLVRMSRLHPPGNLVAKVEYMNPGGSVKERIAVAMIDAAERDGQLGPGGTIIEPTSGNTGVGWRLVGAVRGYRVICTVPDKVAQAKIRQLEAYGVEVIVTPTDRLPEDDDSYYGVARRLTAEIDRRLQPQPVRTTRPTRRPRGHHRARDLAQTDGTHRRPRRRRRDRGARSPAAPATSRTGTSRASRSWEPTPKDRSTRPGPDGDIHQYLVEGVGRGLLSRHRRPRAHRSLHHGRRPPSLSP